jgi:ADP-heptose:LPS heptosyltransferase
MKERRILVIRFSSIGDIVLTSPVLRCIKEQLPGSEVHFLTKKQFQPVVEANPHIDRLWLYDHDFKELIPKLKSQGFSFIADLHKNYRSAFVARQLGVKSASFPKLNVQKWLLVNAKIDLLPKIHIVDRYFEAVAPVGVKNDGKGLDYFIPAGEEVPPGTLPDTHSRGFVAVVIGGKHNTKVFPSEKVIEVCNHLQKPVILLGGNEDRDRGDLIAAACGERVYNACGQFTLNQSASLVKQSAAVLTNDTGLMHIAAAFRKPVVSVWGNTIPGFGMYPLLPQATENLSCIAEVKDLFCRPCSKIGFEKCPKQHFRCMNDISIEPIIEFLNNR